MIAANQLETCAYPLPVASRLIGIDPKTLRRWSDPSAGLIKRHSLTGQNHLSFNELLELLFVNMFHREEVPLPIIRQAAEAAAKKYETDYPLSSSNNV